MFPNLSGRSLQHDALQSARRIIVSDIGAESPLTSLQDYGVSEEELLIDLVAKQVLCWMYDQKGKPGSEGDYVRSKKVEQLLNRISGEGALSNSLFRERLQRQLTQKQQG